MFSDYRICANQQLANKSLDVSRRHSLGNPGPISKQESRQCWTRPETGFLSLTEVTICVGLDL